MTAKYHPYQSCALCSGKAQPGTVDLLKYLMLKFPSVFSMGIYNCRPSSGGGGLSVHSCGRAMDPGIPFLPNGQPNIVLGNSVVAFLYQYSWEFGIHGQIWNRVRYDLTTPNGRAYTGPHPHLDHVHVEQRLEQAKTLTFADYVAIAGEPIGEIDMTYLGYCKLGDEGMAPLGMQTLLAVTGFYKGTLDGIYGAGTAAALLAMRKALGSSATSGNTFSKDAFEQLLRTHAKWAVGAIEGGGISAAEVDQKIATHAANADAHHD